MPGITLDVESDNGLALAGAVGYGFNKNLRVEGEIQYLQNDLDKVNLSGVDLDLDGDTSSLALLLNGYYDFANESAFTPFISAGLGYAKVKVNDISMRGFGPWSSLSDDESVFAWQVGAGASYAVNEKVSVNAKYRYFATSSPDFDGAKIEYLSHLLYTGVTLAF